MATLSREELEAKLREYVGKEIGPPDEALDAVNEAMIRHWCDALDDRNPGYSHAEAAGRSVHGGIVAPPSMLQAWMLPGVEMARPVPARPNLQTELHALLSENGYSGVVATNCEQSYARYLSPGDRVSSTTVIETISEEKATALGIGYFINTRETFRDADGEEVGWQTFRVLKYKPHEQPKPVSDSAAAEGSAVQTRLQPPLGFDNQWWWEAVADDRLVIQKCSDCGELRHPTRPMCGNCRSVKWESIEASGRGTVYSFTILHYPKFPGYEFPLACVLVELEEGVRMCSNILGCDPSEVKIGMKVQAHIEQLDAATKLPVFRPA